MSCLCNSFLNNTLGLGDTEMYLTFYQTEKKLPLNYDSTGAVSIANISMRPEAALTILCLRFGIFAETKGWVLLSAVRTATHPGFP